MPGPPRPPPARHAWAPPLRQPPPAAAGSLASAQYRSEVSHGPPGPEPGSVSPPAWGAAHQAAGWQREKHPTRQGEPNQGFPLTRFTPGSGLRLEILMISP